MAPLPRAYICGLARDCGPWLDQTLRVIEDLRGLFEASVVQIVTNDSCDDTNTILGSWAAGSGNAVASFDGLAQSMPIREDRLTFGRNFCISDLLRRRLAGEHYDWLIMLDLDEVNHGLVTGQGFLDAISSAPQDWTALFANQREAYYDIWALRHPTWCPRDCWHEVERAVGFLPHWGPFYLGLKVRSRAHRRAVAKFVDRRTMHIPAEYPPIGVQSAFGGIGIYRADQLGTSWYAARDKKGDIACEHVAFNTRLADDGGKLYVLPSLLNNGPRDAGIGVPLDPRLLGRVA